MIIISRTLMFSTALSIMLAMPETAFAQNTAKSDAFIDVQRLFDAREYDQAEKLLTKMQLRGDLAVEKYLWLARVQLELGAGIAAEAAIERARELNADYAITAVPFAKALLVQGKYTAALEALRGVAIPKSMQDQAHIVSGDANFALKKYNKAKRDYNLAIEINDENFQPYLGLARLTLRDSELTGAMKLARKAETRGPENTMVQYTVGLINRYMGNVDAAEIHFQEAVRLFPTNIMANIELAGIRINQNRIADAEVYLDTVYAASVNQPMAIYLTAVILATRGDYEEAELHLLRIRSLTQNYLPAIYVRGLVAYQLGKNEIAASALEQVLKVKPNNKAARMALAGTYTNQQRPKAALRTLKPLLESEDSINTAVLSMAAAASIAAGEIERGKLLYQRVAAQQDNNNAQSISGAVSKLAMAQFVTGNQAGAIETISSVSGGVGIEIRELGVMASMQIRNDDLVGARKTIAKIVETAPERALGYNMMGTLSYKEGDYAAAAKSYGEALSRNPKYFAALRNRGLAYFKAENFNNAEKDLKLLLSQQPNDARSKAILGKTLLTVGKAKEAVTYFRDAIREITNSVILSSDYAQALADAGDTTRAIEQARETAKKGADRPDILRKMGLLLLDLGQPAAAERPLSRHVAFLPNSGDAHMLHGRALLSMGLYTGSKISFNRAKNAKNDAPAAATLAWYLFAADALALKQEPALKQLDALEMERRPTDISASVVGDILLHSGSSEKAEKAYRDALDLEKTAPLAIGLAKALSTQGRSVEAIDILERFVVAQPQNRFVRAELGTRFESVKDYEAAANQYEEILRSGIADAATAAKLASVYLRLNNNNSIRLVEQAFLISPEDPNILDAHGWVMLQAKRDIEKAIKSLEKAVRRSPANASYKFHLGMAYLAASRNRDARRVLTQAINLDDSFDGAEEARRQILLLGISNN